MAAPQSNLKVSLMLCVQLKINGVRCMLEMSVLLNTSRSDRKILDRARRL